MEFATSRVGAFVTTEPKSSNCTLYMRLPPRTKSGSGTSHVRLTLDVPNTTPWKPVGGLGTACGKETQCMDTIVRSEILNTYIYDLMI